MRFSIIGRVSLNISTSSLFILKPGITTHLKPPKVSISARRGVSREIMVLRKRRKLSEISLLLLIFTSQIMVEVIYFEGSKNRRFLKKTYMRLPRRFFAHGRNRSR